MANEFKAYDEALKWVMYDLPKTSKDIFVGEKGLLRIKKLLAALGNPQDDYKTIHVAASSGKGTITTLVSQLLLANSHTVATMMSPHVYDFRERLLINGEVCRKSELLWAINAVKKEVDQLNFDNVHLSFYEVALAVSYLVFSKHELDYLVIEVGLGGRLDGSNCIARSDKVSILGQIGLDHTEILGETLSEIAYEKAGIVLKGSKVFALEQASVVNEAFQAVAATQKANIVVVSGTGFRRARELNFEVLITNLVGDYNYDNLALAVASLEYLAQRDNWKFREDSIGKVTSAFKLPGRFEIIRYGDKEIVLDGAHSEQKLSGLVAGLNIKHPDKKFSVVFACGKERDPAELIEILKPIASEFILSSYSQLGIEMKRSPYDFVDYKVEGLPSESIKSAQQVVKRIDKSDSTRWLITGSFFVVAEVGALLHDLVKK